MVGVLGGFFGVDFVEVFFGGYGVVYVVEDVEFCFGGEECGVGDVG